MTWRSSPRSPIGSSSCTAAGGGGGPGDGAVRQSAASIHPGLAAFDPADIRRRPEPGGSSRFRHRSDNARRHGRRFAPRCRFALPLHFEATPPLHGRCDRGTRSRAFCDERPGSILVAQFQPEERTSPSASGLLSRETGHVHAVDDVSFDIFEGERWGSSANRAAENRPRRSYPST